MSRAIAGLLVAVTLGVCQDKPDLMLFARARAKMNEHLKSAPNYVCLETIDRAVRSNGGKRTTPLDLLRFDVAFIGNKELYSWPGQQQFEERDLADLAPGGGVIGTGAFAVHAYNLFRTSAPRLVGWEWAEWQGSKQARFRYDVSDLVSGYLVRSSGGRAVVGYFGSIWIDPVSEQVSAFEVVANVIPLAVGIREIHNLVAFGDLSIGGKTYRLPARATTTSAAWNGTEYDNETWFSDCRQFVGESKLTFDDPSETAASTGGAAAEEVTLPEGIVFQVQLLTPIDAREAHTGDPVEGALTSDIRHDNALLFAKGSPVEGRLIRLQRVNGESQAEVQFSSIRATDRRTRFTAVPKLETARNTEQARMRDRIEVSGSGQGAVRLTTHGNNAVVPRGFKIRWVTVKGRP